MSMLEASLAVGLLLLSACSSDCGKSQEISQPEFSTENQLRPAARREWEGTFSKWLSMAEPPHVATRPAPFADWQPVVAFVHVSDVQLRDSGIKYFSSSAARDVTDWVAPEVKRLAAVDRNDESPALALVGGIGKMTDPAPSFVIHTGDAIDAGSVGELARFLWIMNRLSIPWFSVIGNHDIFLMGNFTHHCLNVKGLPADGVPLIGDRRKFMALHGPGSDWPHAAPTHEPTLDGNNIVPGGSVLHGFDFGAYTARYEPPSAQPRSHYSFPLYTNPPLRIVVLDTNKPDDNIPGLGCRELPAGHDGFLSEDDKIWLVDQIEQATSLGEYVIVAGHHPSSRLGTMAQGAGVSVTEYLRQKPNVIAYLAGHTHEFAVHRHERQRLSASPQAETTALPEIISTATRVDPAFALLIEVLRKNDRLAVVYRSIAPRADGELGAALEEFCKAVAKDREHAPRCTAEERGGFIVATGVEIAADRSVGARSEPTWDAAQPAWHLADATVTPLDGVVNGAPCLPGFQRYRATAQVRNERDRSARLHFDVHHPDIEVTHHRLELPVGAVVEADVAIPDVLSPGIAREHQAPVHVGRRLTIRDVAARAVVGIELETCAERGQIPVVTEPPRE